MLLVENLNQAIALGFLPSAPISTPETKPVGIQELICLSRTHLRTILEVQLTAYEIVRESYGKGGSKNSSSSSNKLKLLNRISQEPQLLRFTPSFPSVLSCSQPHHIHFYS